MRKHAGKLSLRISPRPLDASDMAYLITFCCYGQHLPGEPGSVDRRHNRVGLPGMPESPGLVRTLRSGMRQPPYALDVRRRDLVVNSIQEVLPLS